MQFLTEESDILFKNCIQVFYFYSSWMPFHKKMLIMISKIENKYKDIDFLAIDVDSFKKLCCRFEIKSIPTLLIMFNGKEIKRVSGLILTSAFKNLFAEIYKNCNTTLEKI